jgi:hypothetical protein
MKAWILLLLGLLVWLPAWYLSGKGEVHSWIGDHVVDYLLGAAVFWAVGGLCVALAMRQLKSRSVRARRAAFSVVIGWLALLLLVYGVSRYLTAQDQFREVKNSLEFSANVLPSPMDSDGAISMKLHRLHELERDLTMCGWWVSSARQEPLRARITGLEKALREPRR